MSTNIMMKRGKSYPAQARNNETKTNASPQQNDSELRPFVFEELPDAIRNQIYEPVAATGIAYFNKKTQKLSSTSGLLRVNHLISDEFRSMLDGSPEVRITIHNFNFHSLIEFLESRSDASLNYITKATLSIKLEFGQAPWTITKDETPRRYLPLAAWLKFLEAMLEDGKALRIEYHVCDVDLKSFEEWLRVLANCRMHLKVGVDWIEEIKAECFGIFKAMLLAQNVAMKDEPEGVMDGTWSDEEE